MILVDTSVWIDHLRYRETALAEQLNDGNVLIHPFVIGELACGNLKHRAFILELLNNLPSAKIASDDEALTYIEQRGLMGRGIGFIDVHLLAAAALSDARLWTRDKRLLAIADSMAIAWPESSGS